MCRRGGGTTCCGETPMLPQRWIMSLLGSVGFMIIYGLRSNLSVAIIAMVNHTAVAELSYGDRETTQVVLNPDNTTSSISSPSSKATVMHCGAELKEEDLMDGPFVWDETMQGLVLAAYFYGYIVSQIPGGWVAERYSAKHLFGVGVLINSLLALLSPVAAKASPAGLVVMRIGMGIGAGLTLPAMHVLIACWAPFHERSKIASTIYAGMSLGTLVAMPFSGFLAANWNWESIFYLQGGLSLVWYILWFFLAFDSPADHPWICPKERQLIQDSVGTKSSHQQKGNVPWRSLFTSLPVLAIIIAQSCNDFGWYVLLVKLPTYMRYILKFDLQSNAVLSAVPFLCMWIFAMTYSYAIDEMRARGVISTTTARKVSTFIASVPPGLCLVAASYVGCNSSVAVFLLTLGTTFIGALYCGFLSNHIDVAPPYAGTLMGIANTVASISGIVVPSFVGYITQGNQTVEAWRIIFYIALAIFTFEATVFCIFASGEVQPWARVSDQESEPEEQKLTSTELKSA
ncbi:sialin-like [Oratosquilla oratoria]|uniref:sialin-like n=1 Tax=Oratosquilla oratoria TaxID=337810 RepID=UPI003F771386